MKFFSANIDSLRELYVNQLKTMLSAERQITDALETMIDKSTDEQLKQAFNPICRKPAATFSASSRS